MSRFIDATSVNPLYDGALTLQGLRAAKAGDDIMVYWPCGGPHLISKLALPGPVSVMNVQYAVLDAPNTPFQESGYHAMSLIGMGITPNLHGEWPQCFTVLARYESIRSLHSWLIERGDEVIARVLARRWPTWYRAPKNPVYEGAATRDDLKPGIEILTVQYAGMAGMSIKTVDDGVSWHSDIDLWTLGITETTKHGWQCEAVSIVNTPENRKALVRWLIDRDDLRRGTAYSGANSIVRRYLHEFEGGMKALLQSRALLV